MASIYFDHAATTPLHPEVINAMLPVMQASYGNPSSIHSHGREVKALIEKARKTVAAAIGAVPAEIFFTSGGTEADNMALVSSVKDLGCTRAISSPFEHHAVTHTLEHLSARYGLALEHVASFPDGHIDLNDLEARLASSDERTVVSLMHGNNEIGNLLDLAAVSALCKAYNAVFHCDTVQTMGQYPINVRETPLTFLAGAAHKFNGPKGVGFLYMAAGTQSAPLIHGGAQERNMRGGTENVYGIVGLAKALELAVIGMDEKRAHVEDLKRYMTQRLKEEFLGMCFNGDTEGNSLYTVINASFPPSDQAETLLMMLDIHGISCSAGSACSSGSDVGSHVLRALGHDMTRPALRFSFGKSNTRQEIDYTIGILKQVLQTDTVAVTA